MAKYHKYVFDSEKRAFVGNFEEMYKNESTEIFDSWHQEDTRQIQRKISLVLLSEYNFDNIVDLGCGKGTFSHLLKKTNNKVTAIDVSETAIAHARERYCDIDFIQLDLSNSQAFDTFISGKANEKK